MSLQPVLRSVLGPAGIELSNYCRAKRLKYRPRSISLVDEDLFICAPVRPAYWHRRNIDCSLISITQAKCISPIVRLTLCCTCHQYFCNCIYQSPVVERASLRSE